MKIEGDMLPSEGRSSLLPAGFPRVEGGCGSDCCGMASASSVNADDTLACRPFFPLNITLAMFSFFAFVFAFAFVLTDRFGNHSGW